MFWRVQSHRSDTTVLQTMSLALSTTLHALMPPAQRSSLQVYPGELAEAGVSAAGLTLRQFALALIAAGHDRTAVLRALPAEAEGVGAEARALGELKGRVTATQQRGGAQVSARRPFFFSSFFSSSSRFRDDTPLALSHAESDGLCSARVP